MPHFSWRTFNAGVKEMQHQKDTNSLCAYLRRGVTWTRLSAIATQPVALGGLGLYRENSPEHRAIFNAAPPQLIDGRPEATTDWMEWLLASKLRYYRWSDVTWRRAHLMALTATVAWPLLQAVKRVS